MPISEYILLALLASGGVALPDGAPATTLGAEAIVQPNGGALPSTRQTDGYIKQHRIGKVTTASKHPGGANLGDNINHRRRHRSGGADRHPKRGHKGGRKGKSNRKGIFEG